MRTASLALTSITVATSLLACAPNVDLLFGSGGASHDAGAGGSQTTSSSSSSSGTGTTTVTSSTSTSSTVTGSSSSSSSGTVCAPGPNEDFDGDGISTAQGDCNDCNAAVSPASFDLPGNQLDDDCNGQIDDALPACDQNIPIDSADPLDAARAIGICKTAGTHDWGLVKAAWTMPDGGAIPNVPNYHLGHGVLGDFGPNVTPRQGAKLLALSTGHARRPSDAGYQGNSVDKGFGGNFPPGFPKESMTACPGVITSGMLDPAVLEVTLRAPANVAGLSYAWSFYTHDFPQYICTQYNDTFFTLLSPPPPGVPDGNIAFDKLGQPVSVNGATWEVCSCMTGPPCMTSAPAPSPCSLGPNQLAGTGFDGAAATGWQVTSAPVTPGTNVTLRFGVFDGADGVVDATVVIDDFKWLAGAPVNVGTKAAP